jgi:hypothetical protein
MKSRNLILGIFILFIGVVSLLASLDVIYLSWRIVWRLWPMLLIFIGILILPVKDWLKAVFLVIALAVGVLLYQHEAEKRVDRVSNWCGTGVLRGWWDEIDDRFFNVF